MNSLPLNPSSILCLGAHADDIEIGCGATVLRWAEANPQLRVTWVVFSAAGDRRAEATESARAFLAGLPNVEILVESFTDSYFPAEWGSIKSRLVDVAKDCQPDVVFTHRLEDRHQDHRVIAELTWNAFRDHIVFEYEIPKFEGDLSTPNVYIAASESCARRKIELLSEFFSTQANKDWFSDSTFLALMRIRGLECRASSGLAEGFHARKLTCH